MSVRAAERTGFSAARASGKSPTPHSVAPAAAQISPPARKSRRVDWGGRILAAWQLYGGNGALVSAATNMATSSCAGWQPHTARLYKGHRKRGGVKAAHPSASYSSAYP